MITKWFHFSFLCKDTLIKQETGRGKEEAGGAGVTLLLSPSSLSVSRVPGTSL